MLVPGEPVLAMALRPGWVEVGQGRSEMKKINYEAGEAGVGPAMTRCGLELMAWRV